MEENGKVIGGPYNGKIIISDMDEINLPAKTEEPYLTSCQKPPTKEEKMKTKVYEKFWRLQGKKCCYEWRVKL